MSRYAVTPNLADAASFKPVCFAIGQALAAIMVESGGLRGLNRMKLLEEIDAPALVRLKARFGLPRTKSKKRLNIAGSNWSLASIEELDESDSTSRASAEEFRDPSELSIPIDSNFNLKAFKKMCYVNVRYHCVKDEAFARNALKAVRLGMRPDLRDLFADKLSKEEYESIQYEGELKKGPDHRLLLSLSKLAEDWRREAMSASKKLEPWRQDAVSLSEKPKPRRLVTRQLLAWLNGERFRDLLKDVNEDQWDSEAMELATFIHTANFRAAKAFYEGLTKIPVMFARCSLDAMRRCRDCFALRVTEVFGIDLNEDQEPSKVCLAAAIMEAALGFDSTRQLTKWIARQEETTMQAFITEMEKAAQQWRKQYVMYRCPLKQLTGEEIVESLRMIKGKQRKQRLAEVRKMLKLGDGLRWTPHLHDFLKRAEIMSFTIREAYSIDLAKLDSLILRNIERISDKWFMQDKGLEVKKPFSKSERQLILRFLSWLNGERLDYFAEKAMLKANSAGWYIEYNVVARQLASALTTTNNELNEVLHQDFDERPLISEAQVEEQVQMGVPFMNRITELLQTSTDRPGSDVGPLSTVLMEGAIGDSRLRRLVWHMISRDTKRMRMFIDKMEKTATDWFKKGCRDLAHIRESEV